MLELYGKVARELKDKRYGSQVVQQIMSLNKGLKLFGPQLDQTHKEVLDKYQVILHGMFTPFTLMEFSENIVYSYVITRIFL